MPWWRGPLGAAAACAIAFAAVTADVLLEGPLSGLDEPAGSAVRGNVPAEVRHLWMEDVASAPGDDLVAWAAVAAAATALAALRSWAAALLPAAHLLATSLVWGLKEVFARERPGAGDTHSWAFPSGHAASAVGAWVLATLLLLRAAERRRGPLPPGIRRTLAAAAFTVAAAVGVARVLAGVHWPTDVLAGWNLAGAAAGVALWADGCLARPARAAAPPA